MLVWLCSLSLAQDVSVVEVPLLLGDADPRPRVAARVGEDHEQLAFLDLEPGTTRIGSLLAIRLGIEVRRGHAILPWLRVGELVLNDVRAEVFYGDELFLGLRDVGRATSILPSEGVVRFGGELVPGAPLALEEARDLGAVAGFDLAFDPATGTLEHSPVAWVVYEDAAEVRLAPLLAASRAWPAPEPGDDLLARSRWSELAEAAWRAGRPDVAVWADNALEVVAADRCELHLDIGERRLRAAVPTARDALQRSAELYAAWRHERATEQPQACARARMLLAILDGEAPETLDSLGPEDGLAAAIVAFREGRIAEGPLRHAVAHGGRLDPAVRLALTVARPNPEAIRFLASLPDPSPLTSALAVAEAAGPEALLAAIEADPTWLGGRLVARALGLEDPGVLPLDEAVRLARVQRPGDPAVTCQAWLYDRRGDPPDGLAADCFAARILAGDPDARGELVARWPELAVREER